jgi:hypothetical protein
MLIKLYKKIPHKASARKYFCKYFTFLRPVGLKFCDVICEVRVPWLTASNERLHQRTLCLDWHQIVRCPLTQQLTHRDKAPRGKLIKFGDKF